MNREEYKKILENRIGEIYQTLGDRTAMLVSARNKLEAPVGYFDFPAEFRGGNEHVQTSNMLRFPDYIGRNEMESGYQAACQNGNILNVFRSLGCILSGEIRLALRAQGDHDTFLLAQLDVQKKLLARNVTGDEYLGLLNGEISFISNPWDCYVNGQKYIFSDDGYQRLIPVMEEE